jgi:phosphoglucosamine mutase
VPSLPAERVSAAQSRVEGVHARYIEFAKRTLPRHLDLNGLRIAIDCANGAAYKVAPEALWELGAEVVTMGVEPDGFNINRDVGSTAILTPSRSQGARSAGRHRHRARR